MIRRWTNIFEPHVFTEKRILDIVARHAMTVRYARRLTELMRRSCGRSGRQV